MMLTDNHILILAAARYKDLVYICVRNKDLDADDVAHSVYDAYYQGKTLYVGKTTWDTVAMTIARNPKELMLSVSPEGEVYTYVGGHENRESIPITRGPIRNLASIDGLVYSCGVKRQVFQRVSENNWKDISAPVPSKTDTRMIGFEALSGFGESELYAVGWSGEIFRYDGINWNDLTSPTNAILTSLTCGEDGVVYIVGKDGTFIKGRNQSWTVLDTDGVVDDFWDVHWFEDKVYISSMARLYEFDGKTFGIVNTGSDRPSTCHKLTSSEGVMWSIGSADFFMFDGSNWTRIF